MQDSIKDENTNKTTPNNSKLNIKEEKVESNIIIEKENEETNEENDITEEKEQQKNTINRWLKGLLSFIDIDLLKDPKYLSLMMGMSIAICAEMNFSLLTPIILYDYQYSTDEIAKVLACIAFSDIIFRCISPFVHRWLKWPVKLMYSMSLVLLIFTRTGTF